MIFTFGKHKGKLVSEVPVTYLDWFLKNVTDCNDELKLEVLSSWQKRQEELKYALEEQEDLFDELAGYGGPEWWKD